MPWSRPSRAGAGAGFTTGEPWLPIVRDADRLSVEAQDADSESTLAFVREMLALRGRTPALQLGVQRRVDAAPELFCYLREREDTRLLVALNFRSQTVALALRQHLADRAIVELSTRPQRPRGEIELAALALERDEGIILRLAEDQPGSRGEGLLSDQRSARAG
jgi:alpha-glucosidase